MAAFVVLWNPSRWDWPADEFAEAVAVTENSGRYRYSWSTGTRHKGISIGDRAYLLRQATPDRGLAAVGTFASEVYWDSHWDGSGREAPYADIDFDRVLAPSDVLSTESLMTMSTGFPWDSLRGGGAQVPPDAEATTDEAWAEHLSVLHDESPAMRNPTWTWDEIVLALDLYFRIGVQSSTHPDVIELSDLLNRLPIHSHRPQADKFRNANGVNLKLANLAHLDPSYAGTGMARGVGGTKRSSTHSSATARGSQAWRLRSAAWP